MSWFVYNPDGTRVAECGDMRDALFLSSLKVGRTVQEKPQTIIPETINITVVEVEQPQLNPQLQLPPSEQQPFEP